MIPGDDELQSSIPWMRRQLGDRLVVWIGLDAGANDSANPRDALFAEIAGLVDWNSPATGRLSWAGAQPVSDTDGLDALPEDLWSKILDAGTARS
jgi:hypothetical protein